MVFVKMHSIISIRRFVEANSQFCEKAQEYCFGLACVVLSEVVLALLPQLSHTGVWS